MQLKNNNRGFTLVELIVAIALLSGVLAGAYYFFAFSMKSYDYTQAQYTAELDARNAVMMMEEDIREAKDVDIGGTRHKAVEVLDSGKKLNIYKDIDNDNTINLVQYVLTDYELKRGEASNPGGAPSNWAILSTKVYNKDAEPGPVEAFSINKSQINVRLMIGDEGNHLKEKPVDIKTSISVRSKGVME